MSVVVCPEGQQIVDWGLSGCCRRDPDSPLRWYGLSREDCELLRVWVVGVRHDLAELHTHVPIGLVPDLEDESLTERDCRVLAGKWPLRIDAVARRGAEWFLIECKPEAGYEALGQVLVYRHWAMAGIAELEGCHCLVVTDRCVGTCQPLFRSYGIEVVEVDPSGNRA